MKKLFGTDGIRGHAGEFPLDEATVAKIGASLARQFAERLGRPAKFVIGRDTRESGPSIEAAFCNGASCENAVCESAGIITTPGVAFLTAAFDFDAGIVISASHNPFQDNGIKIFLPTGRKMDEAMERAVESDIAGGAAIASNSSTAAQDRSEEFHAAYVEHLREHANGLGAGGLKIVIDCANGAASAFAPKLFSSLGADVVAINDKPDGRNINHNCGSLHLENIQSKVVEEYAGLGIALDGDADRALFVDENGKVVDGDATLWILANHLRDHGKLKNSTVVATVMSNIGLELALRSKDINLLRADVGDKYVLEKLLETNSEIGGEQSGHVIFPEISLVGDGMMTALLVLKAITEKNVSLSEAAEGFTAYPQILRNVKVKEKTPFDSVPEIAVAAREIEQELHNEGRLLLRYSGTENLARVMIEGKKQAIIEAQAARLASVIQASLG